MLQFMYSSKSNNTKGRDILSGNFESIGSNMYALIHKDELGYEFSNFGVEHELGKGIWIYNNTDNPILCLSEMKELKDLLSRLIDNEENYLKK